MKTKRLLALIAAAVLLVTMAGCTPPKAITTGAFDGMAYSNDFFNLSFKFPDGWSIASKDQMAEIYKVSADLIGSDDKEKEKKLELAKQKTLYLVYGLKHPFGYQDGFNPNINLVCENLGLAGLVVKTNKDYMNAAIENIKKGVEGTEMSYTFGDITASKIGGADFAVLDATLAYQGMEIKQRLLCTLKNNYALLFTLTWLEDGELDELQTIVDSISVK